MDLPPFRPGAKRIFSSAVLAILAVLGVWVLYTYPPGTVSFYPPCVFRKLTGLLCPGCGTTRALHALLHGRVADAFALNPMLFAVMGMGFVALPDVMRGTQPRWLMKPWFAWAMMVMVVGWWIGRNIAGR